MYRKQGWGKVAYAKNPFKQNALYAKVIVGRLPVMSMQFSFRPANLGVEVKKISTPLEGKLKRNFVA